MKKSTIIVLMLTLLMAFAVVSPAFALVLTPPSYTIMTGKLGGADYVIYMPKTWNGRLIMGCHGYNFFENPHP